jgi:DNA polymerase elongation subunit (family B)
MKTKFIPIDYDYFDFNGKNYAKIIGRDDKGKRVCIIDSCDVYLWAILKDKIEKSRINKIIKKISKIKLNSKGRKTKVEKVELYEKKSLDKKVSALKIFATNYKDLHDIVNKLDFNEIDKRRNYDLGYITNYIIEKKMLPMQEYEIEGDILINSIEFGGIDSSIDADYCLKLNNLKKIEEFKFNPRILAYDIETDSLNIGEGEILMISLVGENFKKVLTWKKSSLKPDYVEYVKNEEELLEKFCEEVKKFNPDFLVGYFSDGFDLPYLKSRATKLNVKLSLGIDGSQPKFSRSKILVGKINGIAHIDILRFIKTAYSQYMQSETLSLNEVSNEFLGDSKKEFKIKHSSKIGKNWKKYYEYNLQDSILVFNLFKKFWPDLKEFTKIVQEPIFEVSRYGLSKIVESYIIHNLERFNEIPERRPTYEEISKRRSSGGVEGAFVFEPEPGFYKNIAIFDFTSMHTSIIISHNISKGTLLDKKQKDSYKSPEIEFKKKKQNFYFSKEKGFFPELLNEIFELRKKYKKEFKRKPSSITKARSNAFKVLSASVHGYIGFFGARYYCLECSASILAFVRKFNKEIIEKIKSKGYKVIFSDTDSVGFLIENKSEKEILNLLDKLNSELPGIMHLELEDFYKRGLWVTTRAGITGAKKKYALLDKKNNLKIRGFETVRRDWCNLSRELQNKVIKSILEDGNEKKALESIKKEIKNLKERKINKEKLIIRTQLKKPILEYKSISPHVIAARRMKELNIPISQGNLISYYISNNNSKSKLIRDKVKLPEEKGEYDIKYYLEHQILPAVENILQIFNVDIKEIIEGKKQMKLGDF